MTTRERSRSIRVDTMLMRCGTMCGISKQVELPSHDMMMRHRRQSCKYTTIKIEPLGILVCS